MILLHNYISLDISLSYKNNIHNFIVRTMSVDSPWKLRQRWSKKYCD